KNADSIERTQHRANCNYGENAHTLSRDTRSATAREGGHDCRLNVEVTSSEVVERPAVRCIAWLGLTLDSERMDSLLFLLAKYGLIAEGLKVDLASQAFARGC